MTAKRLDAAGQAPVRTGRFITLEGGEGSGKSTQIQRLLARLAGLGIETVATREPGGSPEAERLRRLLLSGAIAPLGPKAEALVFTAARIDHLDKTILPALAEGCFVICDRFIDSTRAYQGATGKVDAALIRDLEHVAAGNAMPDLTLILDIPPEAGLARAKGRGEGADRFESEKLAFHEAVRQSFLATAKAEPARCVVIDATLPPDAVEAAIWEAVSSRLLPVPGQGQGQRQEQRPVGSGRKLQVIDGAGGKGLAKGKPDRSGQKRRDGGKKGGKS